MAGVLVFDLGFESDRRREPRRQTVADHGVVSVRIRPGIEARLLNLSAAGAHLPTTRRLPPGCLVHVQLAFPTCVATVGGRIVHTEVCAVRAEHLTYRCGVRFDRRLRWTVEATGVRYAVTE